MATRPQTRLTYSDLVAFPDDGRRWELLDGEAFVVPPKVASVWPFGPIAKNRAASPESLCVNSTLLDSAEATTPLDSEMRISKIEQLARRREAGLSERRTEQGRKRESDCDPDPLAHAKMLSAPGDGELLPLPRQTTSMTPTTRTAGAWSELPTYRESPV